MTSRNSNKSWLDLGPSLDDLQNPVFWRDVFNEVLVTGILLATGTMLSTTASDQYSILPGHVGLYGAVIVCLLIEGYGPFSGAHMNPSVSIAFFLTGKISLARGLLYIAAQTIGGAAGAGLGYLVSPEEKRNAFQAFDPAVNGLSPFQSVLVETLLIFNLNFVVLSCVDERDRRTPVVMPAIPISFCIGLGGLVAASLTGGLVNPIVALGPAILSRNFNNYWIFWVATVVGSPLAVCLYKLYNFIQKKFGRDHPHQRSSSQATSDQQSDSETKNELKPNSQPNDQLTAIF